MKPNMTWPLSTCLPHSLPPPSPCPGSLCDLISSPPWICHACSCPGLLYLMSPFLAMLDPKDKAEPLSSDQTWVPSRSLSPLSASVQGDCLVLLWAALLLTSLTVLSPLSLPNGPSNSVSPGSWHSGPSESSLLHTLLPPSSDTKLKLKNPTNLCSWAILLPVGPVFLSPLSMPHNNQGRFEIANWPYFNQGNLVTLPSHHVLTWDYSV